MVLIYNAGAPFVVFHTASIMDPQHPTPSDIHTFSGDSYQVISETAAGTPLECIGM